MTDQSGQDIFQDKPAETPATPTPTSTDVFADRLKAIQNEQGQPKYDSVEKALEALQHSQAYIPDLKNKVTTYEQKIAELEAELSKRASVEDVVSRLTAKDHQDPSAPATPAQASGLSEEAAKQLFEQMLTERQSASQKLDNKRRVNDAIVQQFGDKAPEVLAEKAKAFGVSPAKLGELAAEQPDLVLALFNSQAPQKGAPVNSSVNLPGRYQTPEQKLDRPEKSLLSGASTKDQLEYMKKVRADVYKRYGVES